jgi:hypothetical protein
MRTRPSRIHATTLAALIFAAERLLIRPGTEPVDVLRYLCEPPQMPKKPDRRRASTDVRLELRRQMQLLHAQGRTQRWTEVTR